MSKTSSKKRRSTQTKANTPAFNKMRLLPWLLIPLAVLAIIALIALTSGNDNKARENENDPAESVGQNSAAMNVLMIERPQRISPSAYQEQFGLGNDNHILLDVRTPQEFINDGHIPGAVNINVDELSQRLNEVPQDQPIVIYCRSGNRSVIATQILDQAGFNGLYDLGGILEWSAQGLPVQ